MQSLIQPFKQGVLFSRGDFKVYFLQDMYEPVFNSFIKSNNLTPAPHKHASLINKVSPSDYPYFLQCPRKIYLSRVEQIPKAPYIQNEVALMGTRLQLCFELYCNDIKEIISDPQEFLSYNINGMPLKDYIMLRSPTPPGLSGLFPGPLGVYEQGLSFFNRFKSDPQTVIQSEVWCKSSILVVRGQEYWRINTNGKADFIIRNGNDIVILDAKNSKPDNVPYRSSLTSTGSVFLPGSLISKNDFIQSPSPAQILMYANSLGIHNVKALGFWYWQVARSELITDLPQMCEHIVDHYEQCFDGVFEARPSKACAYCEARQGCSA